MEYNDVSEQKSLPLTSENSVLEVPEHFDERIYDNESYESGNGYPTPFGRIDESNNKQSYENCIHDDTEQLLTGKDNLSTLQDSLSTYTDYPFAVVFLLHIILIFIISVILGPSRISRTNFTLEKEYESPHSQGTEVFITILWSAMIGILGSTVWMFCIKTVAGALIKGTLLLGTAVFAISSIMSFSRNATSGIASGFFFLILSCGTFIFYKLSKPRIPFASVNLSIAVNILQRYPMLLFCTYGALLIQFLWVLIWGAAMISVWSITAGYQNGSGVMGNFSVLMMLLSFFWGIHVIKGIIHCTIAGVVGAWWYSNSPINPEKKSLKRAITTSFGSICYGALIVAIVSSIRAMLKAIRRRGRGFNACLEFFIRSIEESTKYFNKYAFCQVALYGKDLRTAGYDTTSLFQERGWSTVVNDNLISTVLLVGCLVVGSVSGVLGSTWVYATVECTPEDFRVSPENCGTFGVVMMTFLTCSAIGFAMCSVVSGAIESTVATIVVCFAQDPYALRATNPKEFASLVEAWQTYFPNLMAASGPEYAHLRI